MYFFVGFLVFFVVDPFVHRQFTKIQNLNFRWWFFNVQPVHCTGETIRRIIKQLHRCLDLIHWRSPYWGWRSANTGESQHSPDPTMIVVPGCLGSHSDYCPSILVVDDANDDEAKRKRRSPNRWHCSTVAHDHPQRMRGRKRILVVQLGRRWIQWWRWRCRTDSP